VPLAGATRQAENSAWRPQCINHLATWDYPLALSSPWRQRVVMAIPARYTLCVTVGNRMACAAGEGHGFYCLSTWSP
jgi:hypothetical protein